MKKIKVYAGEKRLKDIYPFATKWEVFKYRTGIWTKRIMKVAFTIVCISWFGYGMYVSGGINNPKTVFAEKDVPVVQDQQFPPMLQKICNAESGGHQFQANGNVIRGKVTPDDVGICQIHESLWEDKARSLGYDIYTEQGNKDMALWIFDNYGTAPWSASETVWSK